MNQHVLVHWISSGRLLSPYLRMRQAFEDLSCKIPMKYIHVYSLCSCISKLRWLFHRQSFFNHGFYIWYKSFSDFAGLHQMVSSPIRTGDAQRSWKGNGYQSSTTTAHGRTHIPSRNSVQQDTPPTNFAALSVFMQSLFGISTIILTDKFTAGPSWSLVCSPYTYDCLCMYLILRNCLCLLL